MFRAVSLCIALNLILPPWAARAQDDISRLRAVCAQIKSHLGSYREVHAAYKDKDGRTAALEGWLDGKDLRRIVATVPREGSAGAEEYYLENGQLIYFYSSYDTRDPKTGKVAVREEGRGYFKEGKMFKWLGGEEGSESVEPDEFKAEAERVTARFRELKAALLKAGSARPE